MQHHWLYWLLRTTVKGWDSVQPSPRCVVAARRAWHRAGFGEFHNFHLMWSYACHRHHMKDNHHHTDPVRVLEICRPRLRHNTTAIQGSALVSSTGDSGSPWESAIPAEGFRGRLVPHCSRGTTGDRGLVRQGRQQERQLHCGPCGPTGKCPAGRHHTTKSAQRCPHILAIG